YWSSPPFSWLFLVQVTVGLALAAAMLVTRVTGAMFALTTLGGYLLLVSVIYGLKQVRTIPGFAAGLIEIAAFVALAMAGIAAGQRTGKADCPNAAADAGSGADGHRCGRWRLSARLCPARHGGRQGRQVTYGNCDHVENCEYRWCDGAHQCRGPDAVLVRPRH